MNSNVKKLTQAKKEVKCDFCHRYQINELEYGPLLQLGKITVHQFCMMFSSDSRRSGEYHNGIMGYFTDDLTRSLRSSARFNCKYCKQKGGSVKCIGPNCKVTFHYPCGVNNGSCSEFLDNFRSYCFEHKPKLRASGNCGICHGAVLIAERCVVPACCHSRFGRGMHWICVQKWALTDSKGSEFRCPICQSKDEFIVSMQKSGVYIPAHHLTAPAVTTLDNQNGLEEKWDWEPKNDHQLQLFQKAKENLHLVLVSFKEGLRLNDAFYVMFTQASVKFPLEEMGFDNFYHFLYHCQDTYWLKHLPDSDEMYLFLRAKVDAHFTHIRSLIQQQRFHDSSAGAVRVTSGTTYAEDPSYLLRFRSRPCEIPPAFRSQPAQDFGPTKDEDPAVVIDLKPLNPGGQTRVILPKATIKKNKKLKSIIFSRTGTGNSSEPEEFDARLLRVDHHGWFYLRKITRNNYHWDDYKRSLKEFYEKEQSQQELKFPREEVFRGAQVVAYYRQATDSDMKVYGRCTILDYNLDAGTCNVQDMDDSQVGLAAFDELYFIDELFGQEPPGVIKVILAGTEPFLLTGHVLNKFKKLNVCAIVKVNVLQEFHPIFECPIARIQAWNDCHVFRDLKSMLGIN